MGLLYPSVWIQTSVIINAMPDVTAFLGEVTVAQLDADPYPVYARMRREQPAGFVPAVSAWLVTRHADVRFVAEHPDSFPASTAEPSPVERTFGQPTIITSDGAPHLELRRSFDGKFRPRRVDSYAEGLVRPIAQSCASALAGRDRAELMAEYFEPVSVRSLATVLGLGDVSTPTLRRWFRGLNLGATNYERDPAKQAVADATAAEVDEVCVPRLRRMLKAPDDSTMSHMLHAGTVPGEPRTVDFVLPSLKVAILGGLQEPGHGAGSVLAGLLADPAEQLAAVTADASLIPAAVEEGLRWVAPIGTQFRTAAAECELGGSVIPAGAPVCAVLASANRDEHLYTEPDRFDLRRGVQQQAAFGFGRHFCSGHSFSRHQIRIALEVLLEHFPALRQDTEAGPVRFHGWEFRAPAGLNVLLG
jgi:aromatic O-demethylase, cytochrome P450 subunit